MSAAVGRVVAGPDGGVNVLGVELGSGLLVQAFGDDLADSLGRRDLARSWTMLAHHLPPFLPPEGPVGYLTGSVVICCDLSRSAGWRRNYPCTRRP